MSEEITIGTLVSTTVYSIGGRESQATGPVVKITMSRRYPDRVAFYTVDATGYGLLSVEAAKARIQ